MGAWGIGPFENDDALDFIAKILESNDLRLLEDALNKSIPGVDETELLDAGLACEVLVASEILAAISGNPGDLPEDLGEWIIGKPLPSTEQRIIAHSVVLRALNDSELRELWEETEDFQEWLRVTRDLLKRLCAPANQKVEPKKKKSFGNKLTAYTCCFCAENIKKNELISLSVGNEKGTSDWRYFCHKLCFENLNILKIRE